MKPSVPWSSAPVKWTEFAFCEIESDRHTWPRSPRALSAAKRSTCEGDARAGSSVGGSVGIFRCPKKRLIEVRSRTQASSSILPPQLEQRTIPALHVRCSRGCVADCGGHADHRRRPAHLTR
jgi:hypothetical protein